MITFTLLLNLILSMAHGQAGQAGQADTTSVIAAEEYRVYSALINQRHSEPSANRMFTLEGDLVSERLVLERVKLVVIESNTRPGFNYEAMNGEILKRTLSKTMPAEVEETFADFITKNQRSYTLSNNFGAKIKTQVISEEDRKFYFFTNTGRMDAFFARYPGSQGTLAFSRVGFSPSRDKALVYVHPQQDFYADFHPMWAWSTYFALLTKGTGGWAIDRVYYPGRPEPDYSRAHPPPLTVNLARCTAANRHLAWGLGSSSIEIKGRRGNKCVLQHFSEIEGGYSQSECRIPTSLREVLIYEGGTAFYYSHNVSKHCSVIGAGNLLFPRVKPRRTRKKSPLPVRSYSLS